VNNYFDYLTGAIPQILNSFGPVFESMGQGMLGGIDIALILWVGFRVFFGGMSGSKVMTVLVLIVVTSTLMTYYSTPLPVLGVSFRSLPTSQAAAMTAMISSAQNDDLQQAFTAIEGKLEAPSWYDVLGVFVFVILQIVLIVARALTLFAVSYGFLASATLGIFGPFFIPFLLVPGMDWMFWGWVKSYIQYAFYPVVASAYTLLGGRMIVAFCQAQNVGSADVKLSQIFVPLLVVLVVYCYGILKLPSLVSSMFGGRSGEGAGPGMR